MTNHVHHILLPLSAAVDCGKPAISKSGSGNMAKSVVRAGAAVESGRVHPGIKRGTAGQGSGNKARKPSDREPYWKVIERKLIAAFENFSMKKAPTINVILIWGIMPVLMLTYWLMYYCLKSEHDQWYAYFVSRQAEIFVLSWISYIGFKDTKHAGIATAIMILSGFELVAEICDINTKGSIFDIAWKLVISVLLFYALRHYFRDARDK